jgi:hypothetical protein
MKTPDHHPSTAVPKAWELIGLSSTTLLCEPSVISTPRPWLPESTWQAHLWSRRDVATRVSLVLPGNYAVRHNGGIHDIGTDVGTLNHAGADVVALNHAGADLAGREAALAIRDAEFRFFVPGIGRAVCRLGVGPARAARGARRRGARTLRGPG